MYVHIHTPIKLMWLLFFIIHNFTGKAGLYLFLVLISFINIHRNTCRLPLCALFSSECLFYFTLNKNEIIVSYLLFVTKPFPQYLSHKFMAVLPNCVTTFDGLLILQMFFKSTVYYIIMTVLTWFSFKWKCIVLNYLFIL